MSGSFIVVGGGLAGAKTVEALRADGFTGSVTLLCEERQLPYERPPLSKEYLAGDSAQTEFTVHSEQWYADNDVDIRLGTRASALHTGSHEVELDDGTVLGYDKLVLATGSRPRRLKLPGTDLAGVHYLRRVGDSDRIRASWETAARMVVIGGGWIGLEATAVARQRGIEVSVVETAELPLLAALGREMAEVFAELHRAHGVDLRFNAGVRDLQPDSGPQPSVRSVRLTSGEEIPADCVLIGVGARPEVSLAEGAGLDVDNGVLVDANLVTSDPDVLAVGDIANVLHPVLGERVRVEHWANALNQPATAAATMLGRDTPFTTLPFFYTDQYDLGMEFRGHVPADARTRVVSRGSASSREFVAFWLDSEDRVLAGMNVNVWDAGDAIESLITSRSPVAPGVLTDTSRPLDSLVAS